MWKTGNWSLLAEFRDVQLKIYIAGCIAGYGSCTTTELSGLLTSCLTAVEGRVVKYCERVKTYLIH